MSVVFSSSARTNISHEQEKCRSMPAYSVLIDPKHITDIRIGLRKRRATMINIAHRVGRFNAIGLSIDQEHAPHIRRHSQRSWRTIFLVRNSNASFIFFPCLVRCIPRNISSSPKTVEPCTDLRIGLKAIQFFQFGRRRNVLQLRSKCILERQFTRAFAYQVDHETEFNAAPKIELRALEWKAAKLDRSPRFDR